MAFLIDCGIFLSNSSLVGNPIFRVERLLSTDLIKSADSSIRISISPLRVSLNAYAVKVFSVGKIVSKLFKIKSSSNTNCSSLLAFVSSDSGFCWTFISRPNFSVGTSSKIQKLGLILEA